MSETRQMACCPVCDRKFPNKEIEEHVNRCIFLNTKQQSLKRPVSCLNSTSTQEKKIKITDSKVAPKKNNDMPKPQEKAVELPVKSQEFQVKNCTSQTQLSSNESDAKFSVPLAEQMRPTTLEEYIGQQHVMGHNKLLCSLLQKKDIPSMILWGPPGCGKTSLVNVIASLCKKEAKFRFVKLSAAMAGISDVKDVVKAAQNELKFKRKTILFMDEIHRFNKLQQDVFLPHVENGTIILVGATTENPSFSLNTALLSRCRVIVLEKLTEENIFLILIKALEKQGNTIVTGPDNPPNVDNEHKARFLVEKSSLQWLAGISDGDARTALNSLQLALQARDPRELFSTSGPGILKLEDLKDGIKRSHILYDRKGEEHYNTISALHKSIRASDDNAALYWLTRMMEGGEDPLFIARRLVRAASEDIGLADPRALTLAVSCMQGCYQVGMPECDVLLAECAVYLARAPKSQEVYRALQACREALAAHEGPLPGVPLHLRNATSEFNSQLGYGKGYNTRHKDESNLSYLPQGIKKLNYFSGH